MESEVEERLNSLRAEIDGIDEDIVQLLVKRFAVVEEIGELKKMQRLPVLDEAREAKQHKRFKKMAAEYSLDPKMLKAVFDCIIEYSRHSEESI